MMKRSNLIKGIISGLMLTTVLGSAVLAGVGSETFYVQYNNKEKVFYGSAGAYGMELEDDSFIVQTCSLSSSYKRCVLEARSVHHIAGYVVDNDVEAKDLMRYEGLSAGIFRDATNPFIDYIGYATTYNSASAVTGILDNYTCRFNQQAAPNVVK